MIEFGLREMYPGRVTSYTPRSLEDLQAVRAKLATYGFHKTSTAKMLGSQETIETFTRPGSEYCYKVWIKRKQVLGEKRFHFTIELRGV